MWLVTLPAPRAKGLQVRSPGPDSSIFGKGKGLPGVESSITYATYRQRRAIPTISRETLRIVEGAENSPDDRRFVVPPKYIYSTLHLKQSCRPPPDAHPFRFAITPTSFQPMVVVSTPLHVRAILTSPLSQNPPYAHVYLADGNVDCSCRFSSTL